MSIKIVFEFDGEIMLNDVPVEYSPTRIVEDAIRQLRAEIGDYRDQFAGLCHTLSVGSEGRPEMTANDWRKRVDDGINWLTSPMIKRYETAETERDKLRADIAERDARISGLHSVCEYARQVVEEQTARAERAEAELARLRAQKSIATVCLITDRLAHGHIVEAQLQIDPAAQLPIGTKLYAEPIPAKVAE